MSDITDVYVGVRHTGSDGSSGTVRSGPEIREKTEADLSGTGVVTRISAKKKKRERERRVSVRLRSSEEQHLVASSRVS
jgi:hypothetical protein